LSEQPREQTLGRILTLNGSKGAESHKDVPIGLKTKNWNLTPIYRQNPKIWTRLGIFYAAKMLKRENPSNYTN